MLRAIRPSNAAPHGGRAAAKTDTVTASGPAIFRPEMPRPGPAPKFAPKRPNNPVPGRRNHSADRPGAPASLPGSFRATSGQRAPSPDNRPERPSPPVPNDGFSECHRTGTPRPSARPDQTPGKRGRPPRRSGFRPGTKSYGKRRSPGPAERPVPNRLRTHPECLSKNRHPRPQGRRCREFIRESGSRRNRDRISGP